MNQPVRYQLGLPKTQLGAAAELYDAAFGQKFALAVPHRERRLALLKASFVPEYAICALVGEELLGVAGLHAAEGSLTGGVDMNGLIRELGFFAALRAAGVFALYERKPARGELLMDGLAVRPDMRGQGVGSGLLSRVTDYARQRGYGRVRLEVIDTNGGAQRLYERRGFSQVRRESFPYLKWLLGFSAVTTMHFAVEPSARASST